jgi:hypothetical protein
LAGNYVFLWPGIMALLARYDDNLQEKTIAFFAPILYNIPAAVPQQHFPTRPAKQPNISGFSEVWYRAWFGSV